MNYLLVNEKKEAFVYDPAMNLLTDTDGKPLYPDPQREWLSPEGCPDKDKKKVKILKILLGLQCNYHCEYCSQTENIPINPIKKPDIKAFLKMVAEKNWNLNKIEFWGGEPLLYWDKIVVLAPELWKIFPEAKMSIISNGSLLTREKIDFLKKYNIHLVISHDGPGQFLRSDDPLHDPEILGIVKELAESPGYKDRSVFNAVLTPGNLDPYVIVQHLQRRVGNDVIVSFEGAASIGERTKDNKALQFDDVTGSLMSDMITSGILSGKLKKTSFMSHVKHFIESLENHRPASSLYGKCGMNKAGNIACDLEGNILYCHNTTEKIGHLNDLESIDTSQMTIWSQKPGCRGCLVQQLCKGGCMMTKPGEAWEASCRNSYFYYLGIFAAAFYLVTGNFLDLISKFQEEEK